MTLNAVDFRGPRAKPGSKGQYAGVELHAGLICLAGFRALGFDDHLELFEHALRALADEADVVNQVIEVSLEADHQVRILRYGMPKPRQQN